MSAVKRVVSTSFWEDDKVVNYFSPEDKYFMLYLLTNPYTTQIGIYPLNIRRAAFDLGYSVEAVSVLLERFESKYKLIKRSKICSEIAVKNYLVYSVVKGGQPVLDLLSKERNLIKDKSLLAYVVKSIKERSDLLSTVANFISTIELNDNDNDNENDNDSTPSVQSPYDERTQKPKAKSEKHKYGEYKNVLLSDEELGKLKSEFSDWQDRIERLSGYVASTGKSYKSHYATIRNWARKDKARQQEEGNPFMEMLREEEERKYGQSRNAEDYVTV